MIILFEVMENKEMWESTTQLVGKNVGHGSIKSIPVSHVLDIDGRLE